MTATVPLADMLKYAPSLNSITGGQGSYVMEYAHMTRYQGNWRYASSKNGAGRRAVGRTDRTGKVTGEPQRKGNRANPEERNRE
ncbi:MAG: hypothetical protein U0231_13670 [Nitrospiraceae bacterium]